MTSMVWCVQYKNAIYMYLVDKCMAVECVPNSFWCCVWMCTCIFNTFFVALSTYYPIMSSLIRIEFIDINSIKCDLCIIII